MSRLRRLAPYLLAGPISGPLLAGAVTNIRKGRTFLGFLYAVALLQYTVLLMTIAVRFGGDM